MSLILVPYHLDEPLAHLADTFGSRPASITPAPPTPADTAWQRYGALHESVARAVSETLAPGAGRAEHVTVVSGDCLVALGTVAGVQGAEIDAGVVWFDAHGDVQTVETSASGYPGGMPLRILAGYRPSEFAGPRDLRPIDEGRLALVGARDLDPPEVEYLAGSRIRQVTVETLETTDLPPGPLLLHLDLDVVDSATCPGLRYPVSPGPSASAVQAAVERVLDTRRVVAINIAATWFDHVDAAPAVLVRLVRDLLAAFERRGRTG